MKEEIAALKRILAMLLLPLSVAPVLLLGPSLLRSPVTLAREIEGDLRRVNPFATDTAFAAAQHSGSGTAFAAAPGRGSSTALTAAPGRGSSTALTAAPGRGSSTALTAAPRAESSAGRLSSASHSSGAHHAKTPQHVTGPLSCAQVRRRTKAFRAPARVPGLRVLAHVSGGIRIGWHAVHGSNPPLAGYRIVRDGDVVGQTHGRSYVIKLSKSRSHRVTVAAVDVSGCVGPADKALRIGAHYVFRIPNNAGPSTPGTLTASEVSDAGATMWWLPSTPGGARIAGYRLYRDDDLIGQTSSTTMRLSNLSSLHTYLIAVSAIDAAKRQSARTAAFHLSTTHTAPDGPTQLAALKVTDTSATLAWNEGSATDGKLAGYLIFENGQPERVVSGLATTVTLASERHYTFTVRALDNAGYLSSPAPDLDVFTTHTPPPAPTGLTATEVTASSAIVKWSPSTAVSGRIVGYRVFRNDTPVGQTADPEMTLTSLAPSTGYQITVTAVDSLGAISSLTAPLQIQTEDPAPTHGNVQAFLLASTDQSFDDLQAHYQQIGVVYPTDFNCGKQGLITGSNDPLVTGWAQARQVAVMPRLNCQNPSDEDEILNEPSKQEALINRLAELGSTYGYAGFQVDFEGAAPSERNSFTAFITALAARLHAQGEKLSTVVTAKYYNIMSGRAAMYDDAALSVPSDYLFVLDWGLHWTTSAPGALDELGWFTRVADYTATLPNKSKFVLGMPMYGIDWPNGGGASNPGTPLEYDNVMALTSEYGVTPEWEPTAADPHFSYVDSSGVSHSVWYTDQQSIGVRVALAESLGLGVGLWHLGSEDQSIWELPGLGG